MPKLIKAQIDLNSIQLAELLWSRYEIGVGEYAIWRGRSYIDLPLWINVKRHA